MIYRALAYVVSSIFLCAAFASPVMSVSTEKSVSSHRQAGHAGRKLMSWNDTLLAARIYLGRLPAVMPGSQADTPERVALGKRLYFERGISLHKAQSCHDCHLLTEGRSGVDYAATSKGAQGTFGTRNAPTVINAGFQFRQFWDGRSPDLADQAKGPILNPIEMGLKTPEEVVELLRNIDGYPDAFRRSFPGEANPMTYDRLAEAIAAFERTLVAPARFDRLMDGQKNVMTAREKQGLTRFIQYGCVECHTGSTVGGRHYRKLGQYHPYDNTEDKGRFDVTKKEEDRFVFKVPMLRNVTRTAPYFHDGRLTLLEDTVRHMGRLQLNRTLTSRDIMDLIAFLKTLEGNPVPLEAPRQ